MSTWLDGLIIGLLIAGAISIVGSYCLHQAYQRSLNTWQASALERANLATDWQQACERSQAAYEHEHSIVRALSDRLVIMEFEARARDLNVKLDWEGMRLQ